jgi:putative aldouronate transport system substrate-binding protein
MKKKLTAIVLILAMFTTMLSGCGSTGTSTAGSTAASNASGTNVQTASNSQSTSGSYDQIIMTYLTTGTTPADLQKVQDAVNAISEKKIGVDVTLKAVNIADTFSGTYSMWIGSGEQIDLMCLAFQSMSSYITSGQIQPLDDLIASSGSKITELLKSYPITDGATFGGKTYGVAPVMSAYGMQGGIIVRKDYAEAAGVEKKDRYTIDEIGDILAKIKEAHPDTYPLCQLGSSASASASLSGYYLMYDALGNSVQSGVLMDPTSTKIVDLFETNEYQDFLTTMREWQQAGYIMPDAATTDSLATELLSAEKSSAYAMNMQPLQAQSTKNSYGWDSVELPITDNYYQDATSSSSSYWTIPVTSKNPEAAMKFLNLMYDDEDVANLLRFGIEGEHYVVTDAANRVISFPDGVTMDNSGYYNSLDLYGDRTNEYSWTKSSSLADDAAWTQKNLANKFKSVGYVYDPSKMTNQLVAIGTVLTQYLPSLETGSVEDVEGTYQQFITALKSAGIDDVIADNQQQFDAWLASNQ